MTGRPYILAVDDEEGIRLLYTRILERAGYAIRCVPSAEAALSAIAQEPPAVVLIDIHMPGHGGLWLVDQVRTLSADTAMVLATSDAAVAPATSLKKGITDYVIKPIDAKRLVEAVENGFRWWAAAGRHPIEETMPVPPPAAAAVAPSRHAMPRRPPAPPVFDALRASRRPVPASGVSAGPARSPRLPWILVAVLALTLIGGAAWYGFGGRMGSVITRVSSASGVIRVFDPNGRELTQGSGFFAAPDVFVTAHHVVRGAVRATVQGPGGHAYGVEGIVGVDREHDLAILRTSPAAPATLVLAGAEPAVGDPVSVYGSPLGLEGTLSTGIVSSLVTTPPLRLQITAPISPGSSGSPVVNASGDVIGVAVSSRTAGQALNFAVPARFLRDLLQRVGPVAPLVVAARGAGDDRERHELVGPVRRLSTEEEASEAGAVRPVHVYFDALGRLAQVEDAVSGATTYYTHAPEGRRLSEVVRHGDRVEASFEFTETGQGRLRAIDQHSGTVRVLEYDADGRLASEESRVGAETVRQRRYDYGSPAWPDAGITGDPRRVRFDAIGNIVQRTLDDGTELRYRYTFDGYGNWVQRETLRADGGVVRAERRSIEYWK